MKASASTALGLHGRSFRDFYGLHDAWSRDGIHPFCYVCRRSGHGRNQNLVDILYCSKQS
jgi:hypothetical protein